MDQEPNYGRRYEAGDEINEGVNQEVNEETPRVSSHTATMSENDEKTWSILSHLSSLLGFVFLMPIGALIVWLIYKDRSPEVGFNALQALWYQLAWLVVWVVGSILGGIFTFITFGFGAILVAPLAFILWLAPMAHGCYAAYRVSQGEDYRYPFVADRIDGGRETL